MTWLVLELLVVPIALPLTPLKIHAGLPRALRPLAQSSKAGTIPRDWVALLGDSYAQGAGDWLLSVDPNRNPPFHSAHLLNAITGRDVVSFGMSGAGSLRAMGTEPETFLDYLARTWRFGVPDPDVIVVYFYEGNDLHDNLRDLDHTFKDRYDSSRLRDPSYFREFVRQTAALRTPLREELDTYHWWDNFFLARFVARTVRAVTDRSWRERQRAPDWSPGTVTRASIAGSEIALPDALQGPALDLSEDEIDLALFAHEQAFVLLRERFPTAKTLVVYLPSPLSCYEITSAEVDVQLLRKLDISSRFPRSLVAERSDAICERVAAITRSNGGAFLDPRPELWRASERAVLHGPRDWRHFNRQGWEVLAAAVAARLEGSSSGMENGQGCGSLQLHLGLISEPRSAENPSPAESG